MLYEIPFDSERKAMSVVAESADSTRWMYTNGAPEVILDRCSSELRGTTVVPLDGHRRAEITATNTEMASRALRVLALAFRRIDGAEKAPFHEDELVFAGLAGMIDPPRDEVREAVDKCHRAGIRPVMITGDHSDTALAIARDLGIAGAADTAVSGRANRGRPPIEETRKRLQEPCRTHLSHGEPHSAETSQRKPTTTRLLGVLRRPLPAR